MGKRFDRHLIFIFGLLLLPSFAFLPSTYAQTANAPERFVNPPENIDPDPNYIPGDYVLPDPTQALSFFGTARRRLDEMEIKKEDKLFRVKQAGEIRVTVTKNKTVPVLAYFRDFDGYVLFKNGVFSEAELIISLNSWDTAVPGRDNRVRSILFESMVPEKAVATLRMTPLANSSVELGQLEGKGPQAIKVEGVFEIGGVSQPVHPVIELDWSTEAQKAKQAKPLEILSSDFGLGEKAMALMRACNHKSIENKVLIEWELEFKKE